MGCETFTPPIRFSFIDLNPGHLDAAQSVDICYNEIPATISNGSEASSNAGSITYAWQESTDNVNWTIIAGENQSSYAPPSLQTSTYFIYTVEGLLHNGTTTVEKSGTFFLLQ